MRALVAIAVVISVTCSARAQPATSTSTSTSTSPSTSTSTSPSTSTTTSPVDADEEAAMREARAAVAAEAAARANGWSVRTRQDLVFGWAPRYRLDTSTSPLGLEQQLWRAVQQLPLYHRVSLDATLTIDRDTSLGVHFAGWGSVDLLGDASGGIAAGDVAIAYAELAPGPLAAWVGRRFVTFGPPGGLHVDGGGVALRSDVGVFAEAFVGRPVTPIRSSLLGPQPDFTDLDVAYGARVGYDDAGTATISAGYAELWGHGVVGTRTVDVAGTWDLGIVHLEGTLKVDALNLGVMQARAVALVTVARELSLDADYLHVEPSHWIPAWSILSAFESDDFDEAVVGATLRASRTFALRAEGGARVYTRATTQERRAGYRADLSARTLAGPDGGPVLRLQGSRRDDGVVGYTVVTGGAAIGVWHGVVIAVDGAFAIDDAGARLSTIGRANLDLDLVHGLRVGATASLARAPQVDAELRAMLRVHWDGEVSR